MNGPFADLNPYAGLLSDSEQQTVNNNTMLNLGAAFLQGSGWSPHPVSFGQIAGTALPSALQAQQQTTQQMLGARQFKMQMDLQQAMMPYIQQYLQTMQPQAPTTPAYVPGQGMAPYAPAPQATPAVPGGGGINPLFAIGQLTGNQGWANLGAAIMKQQEPIVSQQGIFVRTPDGGVALAPGYAQARGAVNYIPDPARDLQAAEYRDKTGQWPPGYVPPGSNTVSAPVAPAYRGTPVSSSPSAPQTPGLSPAAAREVATQRAKDQPQQLAGLNTISDQYDRLAQSAQEILQDPDLSSATGVMAPVGYIPGTGAKRVSAKIDTLRSQVAFNVLQSLRDMSKSGGALGQVSNFEEQMLQSNIASLDKSLSPQDFAANLQKIVNYAQGAKMRAFQAYQNAYGQVPQRDMNNLRPLPSTGWGARRLD